MTIIPVFSLYNSQCAEKNLLAIIRTLRESGVHQRFAIQVSTHILNNLDMAVQQQLNLFIHSERIMIFFDGTDASFHGLMRMTILQRHLRKSAREFSEHYPELNPVSFPRWHDYHREQAANLYRKAPEKTLLRGRYENLSVVYALSKDGVCEILPCLYIDDLKPQLISLRATRQLQKNKRSIKKLMSEGGLRRQEDWDTLLMIDGDRIEQNLFDILAAIVKKPYEFGCGRPDFKFLYLPNAATMSIRPIYFDPPTIGPEFVAQLFSQSASKKAQSFSSIFHLPPPRQHKGSPRPAREMTMSLLSRATLSEQDFSVSFEGGNLTQMALNGVVFPFNGGITSKVEVTKHRGTQGFQIESAFAIEGGIARGLRQTLELKHPVAKINGRITNDFLLIGDRKELYLDSYIQHPWIHAEQKLHRYVPQMLVLWKDIALSSSLTLQSQNSDGTKRFVFIDLSQIGRRECLFLPGQVWMLECNNTRIGIDLMYGRENATHLPSGVLIERSSQKLCTISFLPTAEYINPDTSILNGLLEHYSLRILLNISSFDDFPAMDEETLDCIESPYIVYF